VTGNIINELGSASPQLSAAGQGRLIAAGTRRRWSRGDDLIREAESTRNVVLIKHGRVKITLTAPSGKQVILAIRGPGDLLGESAAIDGQDRSATITALTEVDAVSVTRAEFWQLLRVAPDITHELLVMMSSRLRESTRRRLEQGVYDVPTRTARWLLDAAAHSDPIAGGAGYVVRLTQTDLADAVGASRVSVANALKRFRKENAVVTNRGAFHILDPGRLGALADRTTA
jgi:CRP/FNR family transcriptional regulator, cyclic AMP receptor protein